MFTLNPWQAALLGIVLVALSLLLSIWWRQQSGRWGLVVALCLVVALLLSWWSGVAFHVADYRAGCDGLCPGYRGAPLPTYRGEAAGGGFLPGMFLLNTAVYLVLVLAWSGLVRGVLARARYAQAQRPGHSSGGFLGSAVLAAALTVLPLALAPLYLPPPEAHVRGDPLRVAINARREVFMYDQMAPLPVLRVGLEDVRPRRDGQPGMRVCLTTYTVFYLPTGHMYLDMAPEGVHSTDGGVVPLGDSCWE